MGMGIYGWVEPVATSKPPLIHMHISNSKIKPYTCVCKVSYGFVAAWLDLPIEEMIPTCLRLELHIIIIMITLYNAHK